MGKFRVLDDNDSKQLQLTTANLLIDEAIENCIPFIEKTAYLEAVEKSPHLIAIETNPIWFLTYEKWNIWSAAQRIVKYWEWKRTLFGDTRTFLPLSDLSGNGALNDIDIEVIQSGFAATLPKDECGNVYLIVNPSRAGPRHRVCEELAILFRVLFFSTSVLVRNYYQDNHNFPDEGTGAILLKIHFTLTPNLTVNVPDMITEAMPIRYIQGHQIFYRTEANSLFMEKSIIPTFLSINAPLFRKITNNLFHYCSSPTEARSKLQKHNIPLECIPTFLGGLWSYDFFDDWFVRFCNETAIVSQNEMQPVIHKEETRTDTVIGADDVCQEQNNGPLDHVDASFLNQSLVDEVVFTVPNSLNAKSSLSNGNENPITAVYNSWQNEGQDGSDGNRTVSSFAWYHAVKDKNEFCDVAPCEQSVMIDLSVPIAEATNEIIFEKLQHVPELPDLVGEDMCNDVNDVSLPAKCQDLPPNDAFLAASIDLDEKHVEFLKSGIFMMLPLDSQGLCILSYEPDKAVSDDFELQRCCLASCLRLLTQRNKSIRSLIILAYLDQKFVQSKSALNNTFVGIIDTFPTINVDAIHIIFESFCMGWWSYQESAKVLAVQMFGNTKDKISFHVFPTDEDDTIDEAEVSRPQVMAKMALTSDLRALNLYALEATSFCSPSEFFQNTDLLVK